MARPRDIDIAQRRKTFIRLLAAGVDPLTAAERSGHPAQKALQTLSELGYTFTTFDPHRHEPIGA